MPNLDPAAFDLAGVQNLGVQVPLDVDRPAVGQIPVLGNDADQFELPAAKQLALRSGSDRPVAEPWLRG